MRKFFARVWSLYADGFKNMTIGRYLWAIILAKLVVLFLVFRLFFFPNLLSRDYDNDEDRAQAVRSHLINTTPASDDSADSAPALNPDKSR